VLIKALAPVSVSIAGDIGRAGGIQDIPSSGGRAADMARELNA
jgi:hypothetical protein